jgi:acetylornithine deacetylase/succinyl-diaminopimelate desuccinylase family protein
MINKRRLVNFTREIIKIASENPPGNEYKLSMYIKKELQKLDLRVKTYEFAKRRPNIVASLKGKTGKRTLLLSPHIDTVPAGRGWRYPPFSAKVIDGKIYGRGATDCKGNLAVGIEVLRSLQEDGIKLDNNLIFAATVDEEAGSRFGLEPLVKKNIINPDVALILDSDEFNIIVAQKGLIHMKVAVSGKSAHGAYPQRGINAIDLAIEIIHKLKKNKVKCKSHPLLSPPTVNLGTIKGGDKVNIVADWCEFELDFRFPPPVDPFDLLRKVRKIVSGVTKKYRLQISHIQAPCEIERGHYLVKSLIKAAKKNKVKAEIKGSEGATVISFFLERNIASVATGFGMKGQAHTANECVRINDLFKGAKFLEDFIKDFDKGEAG